MEKPPCKDPIRALAERTALVDSMVEASARDHLWPWFPAGVTLLAVGGYGRRHLFPYSDIDLLLLVENSRIAQEAPGQISDVPAVALGCGAAAESFRAHTGRMR